MDPARTRQALDFLPEAVRCLPLVELPVAGATGYCLKDDQKQVVFFAFDEGVSFPDHSHCEQRGVVITGEMTIEIDGQTNLYQAGDQYLVPDGVRHRASFSRPTILIDMSDAPDRYSVYR
ncbi:cupin domain-containing protein [bacterium]|nr:cupin domain-containing protein [bacterium]